MTVVTNTWKAATGSTARRAIVSNDKCNACHTALGVAPTFHAGNRNDAQTCSFCHTVNRTNAGWAVNYKDIVHAIHGAAKRSDKFSWEVSAGATYWKVGYPGVLKNCEQCHLTGTYDFSATASASAVPKLLASSTAQGAIPAAILTITTGNETVPGVYYSPFVTAGANYGLAFSATAATQDPTYSNNLVISPISAACYSCHDSSAAKAHMVQNGGSINVARSVALANTETCLVCHGAVSSTNSTNLTTPAIKAVHRWW
jgi:OmcA/MtrC family decaheme c-type cytochrome